MSAAPEPVVLFVHDAREERARASDALAAAGRRVVVAEDAATAFAAASAEPPAVVVADVTLRGDSGYVLGQRLGADARTRGASIVFLVGPEGERSALQAGALALLRKPLDAGEARAFLDGVLADDVGRQALQAALATARSGDADGARRALSALVERAPGSVVAAWAQYHLGVLLHARGDAQAALEEWSALLEDAPGFWRAHVRLGAAFESAGETARALQHYEAALAANPAMPALAARCTALRKPPETGVDAVRARVVPEEVPAAGAAGAGGPQRTVLVADDSELALEMISDVLSRAGYRVLTAPDGKKALELARRERPDLLILDGLMPGATGFDVCKEIKETIYPTNAPKVVILSAIYTKQRQKSEAKELYKVDDVLAKPFDDAEFLATVRRHVGG